MSNEENSSALVVEKSEVIIVKPSKPTPEVSLSLSTMDNDPFSEIFIKTICVFAPKPNLEDQINQDPSILLQHALSQALVFYYPLAGKVHRKSDDNRLELKCKAGDGVPFIKATVTCSLSSLSYLENAGDKANQLVPCYDPVKGCEGYDPLALQVTKFACGGITIAMSISHSVCDGVGMAQFFRAMIELAAGKAVPTVIPVWERERLNFNAINGEIRDNDKNQKLPTVRSSIATSPYIPTDDMVRETLNIASQYIMKLKKIIAETSEENDNKDVAVTTLEIIAALMWRAKCRALQLTPEGTTILEISAGIRSFIEPPLPEGYYGNAVVNPSLAMTAKELSESTLSQVVKRIKDMKRAALDMKYVSGQLSMIETRLKDGALFEGYKAGFMSITDWRHIGLQHDYWGGLVSIIPLFPMTVPFICILLPASKAMSGGVRLQVKLPRDAMAKFKEEMYAF